MPLSGPLRRAFREPSTSLSAILLVAVAVGVGTALFAYVAALLWPRVEAPAPDELVDVYVGTAAEPRSAASHRELELLRERRGGLAAVAAYSPFGASVGDGETTRFTWTYAVSAGYFELFGARPRLGRLGGAGRPHRPRGQPAAGVREPR